MKLVCMGDSLTEGYQINLAKRWTDELMKEMGYDVINSGICGDTTSGMLARFKAMVIDHEPEYVLIMGGTNDMRLNVSIETVISNIVAMTRYARYHGIQAIVGIPVEYHLEIQSEEDQAYNKDYAKRIEMMRRGMREFCCADELPMIEMGEHLLSIDYLDDGCHPNEAGHYKMMQAVKVALD